MAEKKPSPKKPTTVRKITKVTKPMTKSAVKNPKAPKATGSGTSVKIITKSETAMKKDKVRSAKTGTLPLTRTVTDSMKTSGKKSYKASRGDQKLIDGTQQIGKKGYTPLTAAEKRAANEKMKSKGRGGRGMGGMLGGGSLTSRTK